MKTLSTPELKEKHLIPITNMLREIEERTVSHESHRVIEIKLKCLHDLLDDLRVDMGVTFNEADVRPSVYGENGGGK